jgi:REP element-mobilizing transposase RayT
MLTCDRHWFLTWTMYGNWLPGDDRGFVSNVREGAGPGVRHNKSGTEFDSKMRGLHQSAQSKLKCPPVKICSAQAEILLSQFHETAAIRGWQIYAVAIMANHCHIVVGVLGDPESETILRDLKSYGSRSLNRKWKCPASDTWWTESGSKRKLIDRQAILAAIQYVIDQEFPLIIWTGPIPELNLAGGRLV